MIEHLIVIVGRPGSGKTTAAEGLANQLGCSNFSMGDIIRRSAARSARAETRYFRPDPYSGEELSAMLVSHLRDVEKTCVVLDGSLMIDEALEILRKSIPIGRITSYVLECDYKTRRARVQHRGAEGREQEDLEFFEGREGAFDDVLPRTIEGLRRFGPVITIDGTASSVAVLETLVRSIRKFSVIENRERE
ncbi:MAG: ATP-binding protein [Actinomycetota bacterium]|nr:ATP-binding protein [Actinomycetota bacterium]